MISRTSSDLYTSWQKPWETERKKNGNLKTKKYFLLVLTIVLFSCSENDDIPNQQSNLQSGVVISFDDDYVDEWFEVNNVLEPYD